jgi:hypothetical protein
MLPTLVVARRTIINLFFEIQGAEQQRRRAGISMARLLSQINKQSITQYFIGWKLT